MDVEEVIVEVYLDEKNNSQIPKRVNLVQLLDVKEKKIATIQTYLIELKLEKEWVSTINKKTKNLEYATHVHKTLLSYSTGAKGHLVVFAPNPIMHHEYRTTEPLVLSIHPCHVCNRMFHYCNIVVASCMVLGVPHAIIYKMRKSHMWCDI
jgi:hypothetical protein